MSLFRTRRTHKPAAMDSTREIPRETLLSLLEDAHWAPTHGLTQPWRFHIFATPESRAALVKGLLGLYDRETPETARNPEKRDKLTAGPSLAPVVIAVLARVDPSGKITEWEELAAVSCAVQNLMLSATEKGIGSFWSSPPVACSAAFAGWLGLDETHRALGLLYLGWPRDPAHPPRSTRAPLEERITWH